MHPHTIAAMVDAGADAAKREADTADAYADWRADQIQERTVNLVSEPFACAEYLNAKFDATELVIDWQGREVLFADVAAHLVAGTQLEVAQIVSLLRDALFTALVGEDGPIGEDIDKENCNA